MNERSKIHNLVLSGIWIAIGVIVPMVFHIFSGAGKIFLPMHIPVLLAGFFMSPLYAVCVGIMTPLVSSFITGMPPMYPILPIMMVELGTYGLIISLLMKKGVKNSLISLIIGMTLGRVAAGLMVVMMAYGLGLKMNPWLYMKGAFITGIPGVVIQMIFVPGTVLLMKERFKAL